MVLVSSLQRGLLGPCFRRLIWTEFCDCSWSDHHLCGYDRAMTGNSILFQWGFVAGQSLMHHCVGLVLARYSAWHDALVQALVKDSLQTWFCGFDERQSNMSAMMPLPSSVIVDQQCKCSFQLLLYWRDLAIIGFLVWNWSYEYSDGIYRHGFVGSSPFHELVLDTNSSS
jgi:hypothetical protein